jgi:hypothetical protein
MTNSERNRYDTEFFVMLLARMTPLPHACKASTGEQRYPEAGSETPAATRKTRKKEPPIGRLKVFTGRRQTEWTGATQRPEAGRAQQ